MSQREAGLGFALPPRPGKPRHRGMTAVIDFGPDGFGWTGERGIADLLDCTSPYIDFAKIYAMNALLLPKETVTRIVKLYRDADVQPYAGGILFEYAHRRNEIDGYVAHLESIGLTTLEISENYATLSDDVRHDYVGRFQDRGFSVIYEFGRKNPEAPLSLDHLESIVQDSLDRGVEHIIVEQSEIDMAAASDPAALRGLVSRPWFDKILIEADPYRFPKQHVELLEEFGTDVNLANIAAGQALRMEGLRRGIGRAVNYAMMREDGAAA